MYWKWRLAQAAEIRWWQHYLKQQPPADYLRRKRQYWQRFMQQADIALAPGASVLDAGCGPAGIFIDLPHCRVDALDPLLESYEQQLAHFDKSWYPATRFYIQSLESFQAERAYENIFCLNAINHVADIDLAMDRLVEALAPQGRLWLSVDAHRSAKLCRLFQYLPGDILHPHQHTLAEYRQMLVDRNLEVRQPLLLKSGRIFNYYLLEARRPGMSE